MIGVYSRASDHKRGINGVTGIAHRIHALKVYSHLPHGLWMPSYHIAPGFSQRHLKCIISSNGYLAMPEPPESHVLDPLHSLAPLDAQHESDSKGTKTPFLVACRSIDRRDNTIN